MGGQHRDADLNQCLAMWVAVTVSTAALEIPSGVIHRFFRYKQ